MTIAPRPFREAAQPLPTCVTNKEKYVSCSTNIYKTFISLPNNKILDVTKLKAFADDKFIIARMMISLLDRIENTVGKGENAGCQHFLLFLEFS